MSFHITIQADDTVLYLEFFFLIVNTLALRPFYVLSAGIHSMAVSIVTSLLCF